MKIAFYGSSLLSAYWNGAATYYRGILRALAAHGHDITFYEPDAFDRQSHRDIEPPPWCRVVVYPATEAGVRGVLAEAAAADVVVKASGVGVYDDALLDGIDGASRARTRCASSGTSMRRRRWPRSRSAAGSPAARGVAAARPGADLWRRRSGGRAPIARSARACCVPIYNALDPDDASSGAAPSRDSRRI